MHIDPEPSKEQYRIRQVQTSYPGPGTDGLLTASKIATLKLNAPTPESQVRIRLLLEEGGFELSVPGGK